MKFLLSSYGTKCTIMSWSLVLLLITIAGKTTTSVMGDELDVQISPCSQQGGFNGRRCTFDEGINSWICSQECGNVGGQGCAEPLLLGANADCLSFRCGSAAPNDNTGKRCDSYGPLKMQCSIAANYRDPVDASLDRCWIGGTGGGPNVWYCSSSCDRGYRCEAPSTIATSHTMCTCSPC
jgi:hypothetical protein